MSKQPWFSFIFSFYKNFVLYLTLYLYVFEKKNENLNLISIHHSGFFLVVIDFFDYWFVKNRYRGVLTKKILMLAFFKLKTAEKLYKNKKTKHQKCIVLVYTCVWWKVKNNTSIYSPCQPSGDRNRKSSEKTLIRWLETDLTTRDRFDD